jgi:O-antigen biosynthesis protein
MNHPTPHWMDYAKKEGKATVYMMDDDLLSLYELGTTFDYLAPGKPAHEIVSLLLGRADLAVTYSAGISRSARRHTQRVAELSTNIRRKWLAAQARAPASPGIPLRVAFAGGNAREEEFAALWPALVDVSATYGARIEMHFWGFRPEGLEQLESPVFYHPYSSSYDEYLGRLLTAGFDIMLAPLFDTTSAKRAKCPIKFLEISAAQAVGVYSKAEPYAIVEDGRTGFRAATRARTGSVRWQGLLKPRLSNGPRWCVKHAS